ncbi:MAG TPA: hypothetical protein VF192_11270 [Longimicrobiales bacterium]
MAVTGALIPAGTRVRIQRGMLPLDPAAVGRIGTVVDASEYRAHSYGVILDGDREARYFAADEIQVVETPALPPDRDAARQRRALP